MTQENDVDLPSVNSHEGEEWAVIAVFPDYEIDRAGDVRSVRTRQAIQRRERDSDRGGAARAYVSICTGPGSYTSRQVNVLLEETFGAGAAEAAGFPAPVWGHVLRGRGAVERRRLTAEGTPRVRRSVSARRCHDCGKRTTDYRCPACWSKVRGFAEIPDGADDGEPVTINL
jgi:hypothetical protein